MPRKIANKQELPKKVAKKLSKLDKKIAWREEKINNHRKQIADLIERKDQVLTKYNARTFRKQAA